MQHEHMIRLRSWPAWATMVLNTNCSQHVLAVALNVALYPAPILIATALLSNPVEAKAPRRLWYNVNGWRVESVALRLCIILLRGQADSCHRTPRIPAQHRGCYE